MEQRLLFGRHALSETRRRLSERSGHALNESCEMRRGARAEAELAGGAAYREMHDSP